MSYEESEEQLLNRLEQVMLIKRANVTINVRERDWRHFVKCCDFADATDEQRDLALRAAFFGASAAILAQHGLGNHLDELREDALWNMVREEQARLEKISKLSVEQQPDI